MPRGRTWELASHAEQRSQGKMAPFFGLTSGVALGAIVPLLIVAGTPSAVHGGWIGATIISAIAGARFAWVLGSAKRRLFEMTTWLFVYVFLGIAPMAQLRLGIDPLTTPRIFHEFDFATIAIVVVGMVALMFGSSLGGRVKRPATSRPPRELSVARVTVLGLSALALALYYVSQVGVATLFGSREALSALRSGVFAGLGTTLPIATIVTMTLLVSLLAQMQLRRERSVDSGKTSLLMLGFTFVALFVCVNPISSPRYVFGTMFLAVLAGLGIYGTLRRFRIVAVSSIIGLIFLFPVLDAFRRTVDATLQFENPFDSLVSGDFDSFAQINNTVAYVSEFGPTWGFQALGVPLFWVPRTFWPGKPVDTGVLLAQFREYGFENLSAPLWAELFINGGWVLLAGGMVLFGYWLRRADEHTEGVLVGSNVPPILACIVPFYSLIILRGSLLQSMANFSVLLLAWWLVTRRAAVGRGDHDGPLSAKAASSRGPSALRESSRPVS